MKVNDDTMRAFAAEIQAVCAKYSISIYGDYEGLCHVSYSPNGSMGEIKNLLFTDFVFCPNGVALDSNGDLHYEYGDEAATEIEIGNIYFKGHPYNP